MACFFGHPRYAALRYRPEVLRRVYVRAEEEARKIMEKTPFQAIAYRGASGAALAYPLSMAFDVPVIHVRKPGENSHGSCTEGPGKEIETYIIIDDLIDTGATVQAILGTLQGAKCVSILLYRESALTSAPFFGVPVIGFYLAGSD